MTSDLGGRVYHQTQQLERSDPQGPQLHQTRRICGNWLERLDATLEIERLENIK